MKKLMILAIFILGLGSLRAFSQSIQPEIEASLEMKFFIQDVIALTKNSQISKKQAKHYQEKLKKCIRLIPNPSVQAICYLEWKKLGSQYEEFSPDEKVILENLSDEAIGLMQREDLI